MSIKRNLLFGSAGALIIIGIASALFIAIAPGSLTAERLQVLCKPGSENTGRFDRHLYASIDKKYYVMIFGTGFSVADGGTNYYNSAGKKVAICGSFSVAPEDKFCTKTRPVLNFDYQNDLCAPYVFEETED